VLAVTAERLGVVVPCRQLGTFCLKLPLVILAKNTADERGGRVG
jgi:hypothetical protein